MAIAFDTSADGGNVTAASLTWSHTCGSGSNRALTVGLFGGSTDYITGVTYAGVSMTRLGAILNSSDGRFCYFYGLLSPSTGVNNVVASASSSNVIAGQSSSYSGVGAFETAVTASSGATGEFDFPISVTTAVANCWLVASFRAASPIASTANSGVLRQSSTDGLAIGDSNAALTQGANSLSAHNTNAPFWSAVAVAMEPAASGSPRPSQFFLSGLGHGQIMRSASALAALAPLAWVIERRNKLSRTA